MVILKLREVNFRITPKCEFYKSKECTKISNQLEVVDVDDAEEYWRNISKAFEEVGRVIAVATRCLKNKGIFRKIISFAGWMPYYFLFSKQKGAEQGLFFMNALNKSLLQKMSKIYETSAFKTYLRYSSPNVEIESKIFIEMSIPDALYEGDNLNSKEIPSMVKHDLDLPFRINMKDYDKNKFIKMRIISQNDWGTIDWKTGQLIDPDCECVKLPVAVIFLHGGGFVFGSSGTYQYIIRKYAVETGYPIFAIDYRLAPEFKFPTQTNDCFQAYLWVRYYSEKYLKVKFDKIILLGDSAGGCLSFSLCSTAIRKRCITPDGMVLAYPGFCVDRTNFTPSLLLSADEPYLNVFFVDFCLSSYITDECISSNYLASPQNTPK